MNKTIKNKITNTIGFTIVAAIVSFILGFFTFVIVHISKSYQFFAKPENAHYTEYNTPHAIDNAITISALQDPITIIMLLLPFVIIYGCALYSSIQNTIKNWNR